MKEINKTTFLAAHMSVTLTLWGKEDNSPIVGLRYSDFDSYSEEAHEHWPVTSFVTATPNLGVIKKYPEQVKLSLNERTLSPLDKLASRSADYTKNTTHSFSGHIIENDGEMVEVGIEIYDGCAYRNAELADYRTTVNHYGRWSYHVMDELSAK